MRHFQLSDFKAYLIFIKPNYCSRQLLYIFQPHTTLLKRVNPFLYEGNLISKLQIVI